MRSKISIAILSIIMMLFITTKVLASWAGITPKQALDQADVILVGMIQGKVGEEKLADGLWTTEWKVLVSHYLKGQVNAKEIVINTPGAADKSVATSIDYPLDEKGKQVLLFLRHREGFYEPLSPQGVVGVDISRLGMRSSNLKSAVQLVVDMEVLKSDFQPTELKELKALLSKTNLKFPDQDTVIKPDYQSTWLTAKIVPALVILGAFIGILVGFLWLTRGKKSVK